MLRRIAAFRDDVIFLILLYQMYICKPSSSAVLCFSLMIPPLQTRSTSRESTNTVTNRQKQRRRCFCKENRRRRRSNRKRIFSNSGCNHYPGYCGLRYYCAALYDVVTRFTASETAFPVAVPPTFNTTALITLPISLPVTSTIPSSTMTFLTISSSSPAGNPTGSGVVNSLRIATSFSYPVARSSLPLVLKIAAPSIRAVILLASVLAGGGGEGRWDEFCKSARMDCNFERQRQHRIIGGVE